RFENSLSWSKKTVSSLRWQRARTQGRSRGAVRQLYRNAKLSSSARTVCAVGTQLSISGIQRVPYKKQYENSKP
uniref:Uncharacterized protein n=1 Tax=Cyclopterus lumpus TaxID=8103 RepID=A0A8C2ZQ03_CYCLU